ncbi:hypothetical protein ES319_D06G073800v1 [Gossypium barbadense]|uniref:BHLH domain-containing protein n=2 Tax=Gossypium TaxID=3633 RepID=A0A5J5R1Q6_GOSBA|nr:hypothetical protein ES319_D06G073800v1 [Gossypium barbadense]TYG64066.1 hypothetical protein ES288_D06G079200v1 [Gossypium darwinii]
MNRGVLQSSPLQQMTAGNLNWWNINTTMRPPPTTHLQPPSHFLPPPPPTLFPQFTPTPTPTSSSSSSWNDNNQELPQSWSQLLFCGLMGEEEKGGIGQFQVQPKKLENWEEQALQQTSNAISAVDVKQENPNNYVYGHANEDFHHQANKPAWSHQIMATSSALSPKSGVTSFSSKMLEFSGNKADARQPHPDRSSECNSSASGGAWKKARVQPSATQSTFKVRKEKLGDRITALHQLVSPFGKTDTASVLLEAIGYIRFLQSQIEALSLPYLGNGSGNIRQQQPVQGERNCIFPEDPGRLLNENSMKRKGGPDRQECDEEPKKDLRSRGLCLVPVSCTLQVGSDNGADYWAPAL